MLESKERKRRGRPCSVTDRHISDKLLRAAEECLVKKSPDELTRQEIAAAAGTNSAMIGYYFKSKEGLFRELLTALMRDLCAKIASLEADLIADFRQPTRRIIEGVAAAYQANAGACRILSVELTKAESAIKRSYITRDARLIVDRITSLLQALVSQHVYAPVTDIRKVAITIRLLATHPHVGPSAWSLLSPSGENDYEAWIDHLVDMFDSQLRPTGQAMENLA